MQLSKWSPSVTTTTSTTTSSSFSVLCSPGLPQMWSSCLFLSVGITCVCHHTWLSSVTFIEDKLWQWALCSYHFSTLTNGFQYPNWNDSPRMQFRQYLKCLLRPCASTLYRCVFAMSFFWNPAQMRQLPLGMGFFSDFQLLSLRISVFHRPRRIRSTEPLYFSSIFFPQVEYLLPFLLHVFPEKMM